MDFQYGYVETHYVVPQRFTFFLINGEDAIHDPRLDLIIAKVSNELVTKLLEVENGS